MADAWYPRGDPAPRRGRSLDSAHALASLPRRARRPAAMPPVADRLDLAQRTMTAARRRRRVATEDRRPSPAARLVRPRDAGGTQAATAPRRHRRSVRDQVGRRIPGEPRARPAGDPRRSSSSATRRPASRARSSMAARSPPSVRPRSPASPSRASARSPRPRRAERTVAARTIIGAGVQGRSPSRGPRVIRCRAWPSTIVDRHADRAAELADIARGIAGIDDAHAADGDPRAATVDADVVITAATFTDPARRQTMDDSWLAPDALVSRRLRHDARGFGRPRGGPLPDRRPRTVPRQSRCRTVRRVPGPGRHAR